MLSKKPKILIVDDDHTLSEILVNVLDFEGYQCDVANDGKTSLGKLSQNSYDLLLLDLRLPDISGMEVLKEAMSQDYPVQAVMISGQGTIHKAVEATRMGAYDFLEKPLDTERILVTLKNALERGRLEREKANLLESVKERYTIVGESPKMRLVQNLIEKAALTDTKVLIDGENGTGKELVARSIYMNGQRAGGPFVIVNCAAIPDTLIESELFGYKKGAFTGAVTDKPGRFQLADLGTLFLDEVGDMSLMTQAKVLRVLEENTLEMVGDCKSTQIDVRIITATNKDLNKEMKEGRFREDLFFRLNVLNIKVPPLRERRSDIPLLVKHFMGRICDEHGVKNKQIMPPAVKLLSNYQWPGNVRELRNFIEKVIVLVDREEIYPKDIYPIIGKFAPSEGFVMRSLKLREARIEFEKKFICNRLDECNWNMTKASEKLGIPRTYLHKKLKKLGIEVKNGP